MMYFDESDFDELPASNDDHGYVCDHCGEDIPLAIDFTEGTQQTFVQDCPVC